MLGHAMSLSFLLRAPAGAMLSRVAGGQASWALTASSGRRVWLSPSSRRRLLTRERAGR